MNEGLELYRRSQYIFTETQRTFEINRLCTDDSISEDEKMVQIGKQLIEGQRSSLEDYDNSGPELEEILNLARESGSLGGKISGAGWGGCCVSLVHKDNLKECLEKMKTYYFREREAGRQLEVKTDLDNCLFETVPGQGACVLDLSHCEWNQ